MITQENECDKCHRHNIKCHRHNIKLIVGDFNYTVGREEN